MVRVTWGAGVAMMVEMIRQTSPVGQCRIEEKGGLADPPVCGWTLRPESAVHGVVGHNEQPGLEHGAHKHGKACKSKRELGLGGGEQDEQTPQPGQENPGCQQQAAPGC